MLAGGLELVRAYERLDLERRVQLYRPRTWPRTEAKTGIGC